MSRLKIPFLSFDFFTFGLENIQFISMPAVVGVAWTVFAIAALVNCDMVFDE